MITFIDQTNVSLKNICPSSVGSTIIGRLNISLVLFSCGSKMCIRYVSDSRRAMAALKTSHSWISLHARLFDLRKLDRFDKKTQIMSRNQFPSREM